MRKIKLLWEQVIDGRFLLDDRLKLTAMNIYLLIMHIILLILFHYMGCVQMELVNVGSISIYLLCFVLLCFPLFRIVLYVSIIEIILHVVAAVVFLGLDYGFQMYLMSLVPLGFYMGYRRDSIKDTAGFAVLNSVLSVVFYVLCYIYGSRVPPLWSGSQTNMVTGIYIWNGAVIFLALMIFTALFTIENYGYQLKLLANSRELDYMANTDSLTGLNNRRSLQLVYGRKFCDCDDAYFIMGDIDDFKKINDTYGHECGDYVLKDISAIMKECVREEDFLCRWGGEEMVIMTRVDSIKAARVIAERIRMRVQNSATKYGTEQIHYTMTFGIAKHVRGDTLDTGILNADLKMYEGKKNGKNRVVL